MREKYHSSITQVDDIHKEIGTFYLFNLLCKKINLYFKYLFTEQMPQSKALELFSFILGALNYIDRMDNFQLRKEKRNFTNKISSLFSIIKSIGNQIEKINSIADKQEIYVKKGSKLIRLIPHNKPLLTTPKYILDEWKELEGHLGHIDTLNEISNMYMREMFKASYLRTIKSYLLYKIFGGDREKFQKFRLNIEFIYELIRSNPNCFEEKSSSTYLGSLSKLLNRVDNETKTKLYLLMSKQNQDNGRIEFLPISLVYDKTKNIILVNLNTLNGFYQIIETTVTGEMSDNRGKTVEDIIFARLIGADITYKNDDITFLNVMNPDKSSEYVEIADIISIGNTTGTTYVMEVKDRLITTPSFVERELKKFQEKQPDILKSLEILDIPTDSVEFIFLIDVTPVSVYENIKIIHSNDVLGYLTSMEGFRGFELHDESENLSLNTFPDRRGGFYFQDRQFRKDIGRVYKILEKDREIAIYGYNPNNFQALFWADVPGHMDINEIRENDFLLFLLEDRVGGWQILSLHDYKKLNHIEKMKWLNTEYNDLDEIRY